MATHKFAITFDNNVQDGDTTALQMNDTLIDVVGIPGAQINHIRDDAGKLVSLELELPDAAAKQAAAAIDANPGISNRTVALPEPLLVHDLTNMDGGVGQSYVGYPQPYPASGVSPRQQLELYMADATGTFRMPANLGNYEDVVPRDGVLEYLDILVNSDPNYTYAILNLRAAWATDALGVGIGSDFTLVGQGTNPAAIVTNIDYTVSGVAQPQLPLILLNDVVLPKPTKGLPNLAQIIRQVSFWVTKEGHLYQRFNTAGDGTVTAFTYDEAIANGRL